MDKEEILRLQTYLREKFGNDAIYLLRESLKASSSEEGRKDKLVLVNLGDEFIGTIYRDDEDGSVSYDFNMAILDVDLPASGA